MPEFVTSQGMLLLTAVLGYLLGSIPFGVVVTRAMGLGATQQATWLAQAVSAGPQVPLPAGPRPWAAPTPAPRRAEAQA